MNFVLRKYQCVKVLLLAIIVSLGSNVLSQEYQTCVAKEGDGIYRLLSRHGYSSADFSAFIELNKSKLGKNNSLFVGSVYRLPLKKSEQETAKPTGEFQTYEIFGDAYKDVEIKDQTLKGAVFYVVGGHGGPDPGAIGKYGSHTLCEDEYAYDVSLRLARNLIEHGATVYMIIRDKNDGIRDEAYLKADKDEVCYPKLSIPLSQGKRLRQRVNAVNKLYKKHKGQYQRMVILHIDSRRKGKNIDVFFYHYKKSKTGKKLANRLQETFQQKYAEHQPGRGYKGSVSSRNLYVIKYSSPTAVFMELGNINHQRDQQRFIKPNNRRALAKWLTEGLIKDFEASGK